jgi:hypothetical protein
MEGNKLKSKIHKSIFKIMEQRITDAKLGVAAVKEAQANDTKSSMGDKYETGSEMMAVEREKYDIQLDKALTIKSTLEKIIDTNNTENVELGSLIIASNGIYFLSFAFGKLVVDDVTCYVISTSSPVGNQLLGKSIGDEVAFGNNKFTIKEIY